MIGDYTKVPLRRLERWTGARMQQGRVLLDHEWNLNLDAHSRNAELLATDVIGPSGVVADRPGFAVHDFEVSINSTGTPELTINPGRMWVGGLLAMATTQFSYTEQFGAVVSLAEKLPSAGRILVYLDAFVEHVQPAENLEELVDPALDPIETSARTRVGYRVRFIGTTAPDCRSAWEQFLTTSAAASVSTGTLTITRTGAPTSTDPCNPPGDPRGALPDGLLRIEVMAPGAASTARFAWSYEDGAAAVAVALEPDPTVLPGSPPKLRPRIQGTKVTLVPSATTKFAVTDVVEVSWLSRRADRRKAGDAAGDLYAVTAVDPSSGGDVVTLDRAVGVLPTNADGVVLRRWDGQSTTPATAAQIALRRGNDHGIRFQAIGGYYQPGDWWGARLREAADGGIELRSDAEADGIRHAFAPLAIVDLSKRTADDCRPRFTPLTLMRRQGTCTISIGPEDNIQEAIDQLKEGGELCLAAGDYVLTTPIKVVDFKRLVINGAGPATIIRSPVHAAFVFQRCREITVRDIRVEGGPAARSDERERDGALTFLGCRDVLVTDCVLSCPDGAGSAHDRGTAQACMVVRADPAHDLDSVRVERNMFEVGAWQTGALIVDPTRAAVVSNRVTLAGAPTKAAIGGSFLVRELGRMLTDAVRDKEDATTIEVKLPLVGSDLQVYVVKTAVARPLVEEFARRVTRDYVLRHRTLTKALEMFGRDVAAGRYFNQVDPAIKVMVESIATQVRAAGEGIVIGGTRIGTIEVLDNVIEGVVQGIHVGVSNPTVKGRESAERLLITRNVIHCLVPRTYDSDRLAVFVGNARSVHVKDTIATVRRTGATLSTRGSSLVEGVRVHGQIGPFLCVRQTSLEGFDVGVRVVPLQPIPRQRMWLVAETMASGGATGSSYALDAPPEVDRERNVPSAGWRTTWTQIVPTSFGGLEGLVFYDRTNGFGEFYTVDGAGNMNLLKQHPTWRKTWDVITPTQIEGVSGLLFYDRAAGEYAMYTLNSRGEMTFQRLVGGERKTWEQIVPTEIAGAPGLLFSDPVNDGGYLETRRVGPKGALTNTVQGWPGLGLRFTPSEVAGTSALVAYNRTTGAGRLYRVDASGNLYGYAAESWGANWDQLVTVRFGGALGFLLYNAQAGVGQFREVRANGTTAVKSTQGGWRKDWSSINPATFGGLGGLVFYARSGARGAFYLVDASAMLSELMTSW